MKHKFISLMRILHAGARNFIRNAWLSTAATAVMVVTLTVLLGAIAINMALNDTIDDIASNITLSVYLKDNTDSSSRDKLQEKLEGDANVKGVEYVSKQRALDLFREWNKDNPELLEGLSITDNALPASLEVKVHDLSRIENVGTIAKSDEFSDIVESTSIEKERHQKSIDTFAGAQNFITISSLITAGVFAAISVLIIFNTIRMAVFTRSQEIEIMKLIGATPGYIRGPFLFESSLYGAIAGILSFVAVYSALLALGPKADSQKLLFGPTVSFFAHNWLLVLLGTVSAGVIVGYISSSLALFRYLRLKKW
ncbi:ABC transporter permease [Candidatus Saccharibacteria bacterium CPR2]|nr:ABC transporter permease [Candidatus Saccharibacteria bacterium CPR2]